MSWDCANDPIPDEHPLYCGGTYTRGANLRGAQDKKRRSIIYTYEYKLIFFINKYFMYLVRANTTLPVVQSTTDLKPYDCIRWNREGQAIYSVCMIGDSKNRVLMYPSPAYHRNCEGGKHD